VVRNDDFGAQTIAVEVAYQLALIAASLEKIEQEGIFTYALELEQEEEENDG